MSKIDGTKIVHIGSTSIEVRARSTSNDDDDVKARATTNDGTRLTLRAKGTKVYER